MKKLLMATAFVVAGLTAGASVAQESKAPLTAAEQAAIQTTLATARSLISYGETKGDALALVTAAKMVASVPGRVLAKDEKGPEGASFDIEGVLKKAEDLAQGDPLITKVAADVRTAAEANSKAYCWIETWCDYYYCYDYYYCR